MMMIMIIRMSVTIMTVMRIIMRKKDTNMAIMMTMMTIIIATEIMVTNGEWSY